MPNLIFILIFLGLLAVFFTIASWIGHLLNLDDLIYSPSEHKFIKYKHVFIKKKE